MDSSSPHTSIPVENDPANPIPPTERTTNDDNPMPRAEDAAPPTTIADAMCTIMVDRERPEKEIAEEMQKQDAERAMEREKQEHIRQEQRRHYKEESERRITATNS